MDKVQEKSGIILQDEYWNGNILITDDILIPKNVKVVVAPNTNIKFLNQSKNKLFNKKYKLNYLIKNFNLPSNQCYDKISVIVQGKFILNGLPEEFVNVGNCLWNGIIYVAQGATLRLKYTRVRYSFAIICDINSKITRVDDCIIEQCCVGVVGFSKIIIKNSRINFNDIGIICYKKSFLFENKIVDNFLTGLVIKSSKVYVVNNGLLLNNVGINISKSTDIKLNNNVVNNNNVGTIVSKSNKIFINNINYNNFTGISVKNNSANVDITGFIAGQFGIRISDFSNINIDTLLFANTNYCIMAENSSTVNISSVMVINSLVGIIATQATQLFIKKSDFSLNSLICVLEDETFMFTGESKLNSNSFGFFIVGNNPKLYNLSTQLSSSVLEYSLRFFSELTIEKCEIQTKSMSVLCDKSILSVLNSKININGNNCVFAKDNSVGSIVDSVIKVKDNYFAMGADSSFISVQKSKILSVGEGVAHINNKSVLSIEESVLYSNKRSFNLNAKAKMYLKNSRLKSKDFICLNDMSLSHVYGSDVKGNIFQNNGCLYIDNSNLNSDDILISGMLVKLKSNKIKTEKLEIKETGIFYSRNNEIKSEEEFSIAGRANLISNRLNCGNISITGNGILEAQDNEIKLEEDLKVIGIANLISNKLNGESIEIENSGRLEATNNEIDLEENFSVKGTVKTESNKFNLGNLTVEKLGILKAQGNEIELEEDLKVIGIANLISNKLNGESIEIENLGRLEATNNEIDLGENFSVKGTVKTESNKFSFGNLNVEELGVWEAQANEIKLEEDLKVIGIANLISNKLNGGSIKIENLGRLEATNNEIGLEENFSVIGTVKTELNKFNLGNLKVEELGVLEAKGNEIELEEDLKVIGAANLISNKINGESIDIGEKGSFETENNEFHLLEDLNIKGLAKIVSNKLNCKRIDIEEKAIIEAKENEFELKEKLKVKGLVKFISNNIKTEVIETENFSDLYFINSNLTSNKIILQSKCTIDNTVLNLKQGIYKYDFFEFICKDSKIYSDSTCFNVKNYSNNFFNNTSLTSKDNYAIVANNTNLEFNNVNLSARKGFLCDHDVNCKINKSKAQILFNFCNVTKTNFYVDDLDLVATIPKECFFIDSFSTVNLKNINLKINNNPIFMNFLDNKPLIYLLGNSKLSVDSFCSNVNVSNRMFFLRSDDKTIFELKSINVFGLYNFLYMGMLASGNITDSKIETRSLIISMYQNSNLNITNTELMNLENFKFLVEDNTNLYIEKIKVYNGQLITMSKNSQVYITGSDLKLDGLVCDIKGNSYFKDTSSNWQINDTYVPTYAFYVQDNTKVDISSSDINIKETFLYCTDKSFSKLENVSILSETNNHMLLLEDKTNTEIVNSKLNVYSLAQLKNYANIMIEKTSANIKDVVIDLIGNSKAFINKVLFKCLDKNKSTAFKVLHNSKINIEDSTVDNFYIGLKYENKKNVTVENTEITGKNKMLFTNDKRFLSFSNPIQKSLLYKFQQFVLSTNNIFPLNKLYDFVYVLSITIYKFFMNQKDIQSLYLRRGMLNNWIAGSSDIDYLSILEQTELDVEYKNIFSIKKRYKKLKKLFPFYGENLIFNNKELDFYLKYGGIRSKTLKNSKLLYGKKQSLITDIIADLKHKTDIIKEILNSYILLSNNYFYNFDIISDICFSKASVDILKYIEYFYSMKELDKSRISYLEQHPNDITNKLCEVLKKNIRLGNDDRDCIYGYVFNELEKLAVNFNKEIILNNTARKINVSKKGSLDLFEELEEYKNDIISIALDDPGLAYIVLNNSIEKNKILSIYKQVKENYCFYNTPILFFTENIYQMLLLSNFRNNPFECYKQCNISDKYYERRFYIYKDYQYYCQKDEMLKKLIISSLAEKSVQINEIDITRNFDEIKAELYEIFVDLIQFHLYLKNGKIIQIFSSTNIIKEYETYNKTKKAEINNILLLFEDSCKLKDEEKIQKLIIFIKNLKNEILKNYE